LLLCNTLYNYDWSCVLNENSVDSAVYNFTASMSEGINKAILSVKSKRFSFPHWFSKFFYTTLRNLNHIIITVFLNIIVN
jgi:hypothetical protein